MLYFKIYDSFYPILCFEFYNITIRNYTKHRVCSESQWARAIRTKTYKYGEYYTTEDGETDVIEIAFENVNITEDKPIAVGQAILQYRKRESCI